MSTIDTQIDSFIANLETKGYRISDFALFSPGSVPLQEKDFSPIGQSCTDEGTNQEVWTSEDIPFTDVIAPDESRTTSSSIFWDTLFHFLVFYIFFNCVP